MVGAHQYTLVREGLLHKSKKKKLTELLDKLGFCPARSATATKGDLILLVSTEYGLGYTGVVEDWEDTAKTLSVMTDIDSPSQSYGNVVLGESLQHFMLLRV